jgi:hypothetical protein
MVQLDAFQRAQCPPKFESLAIHAAETDRENRTDAKPDEVIDHGTRGSSLGPDIDDITDREAGFDGSLRL